MEFNGLASLALWSVRPFLYSAHPAFHLANPGPAGPESMPGLMNLGRRVPFQHIKDGADLRRCWNSHVLEKCLTHICTSRDQKQDLKKPARCAIIPLLSLPHEPVCVHFNIVVFAYDPKSFVNRLFEPYKNSHKSRHHNQRPSKHLRDFWTTEADVPLFTANGELEGGVDMLFYDGADECVGRSSDWPHRRWHLLADGQITAAMVDRVELLPPDAMAELQALFGDNSEYFESMNPDSIITIYLMIS